MRDELPSPSAFVRALAPALRQAASIARALEGRVANRPKSATNAVKAALTIADTAAQEALLVPLLERFPGVGLEAEEETPTAARFSERRDPLVVVDPIDGTLRFYLEGAGPYAVMVGLAIGGEYAAALLAMPREGLYFDAVRGGGAHVAGKGKVGRGRGSAGVVLVSHDLPAAAVTRLREHDLEVLPACGGAIAVAPLVPGARAGLRLARGTPGGVSIRGRIGALIAEESGALVRCERGPFPRRLDEPAEALLVASDAAAMQALEDALSVA